MNNLINNEFFKRIFSLFIFVPLVIIPIFYNNYLLLIVYLFINSIIIYELNNLKANKSNISLINSGIITSCIAFIFFILILISYPNEKIKIVEIIFTIWIFDTFSYLGGKLIGGKKLIPKISSGKTISGLVTGIIITLLVSQSYNYIYTDINYLNIILTLAVILFSFIGDIYASIIKRATSVKDSGHLLPGHGGFYDRFDSFIGVFFSFSLIGIFYA